MATPYARSTTRSHRGSASPCPVIAIEEATDPYNSTIHALNFPDLVIEQHALWQRCMHGGRPGKWAIERLAGIEARLAREGEGR